MVGAAAGRRLRTPLLGRGLPPAGRGRAPGEEATLSWRGRRRKRGRGPLWPGTCWPWGKGNGVWLGVRAGVQEGRGFPSEIAIDPPNPLPLPRPRHRYEGFSGAPSLGASCPHFRAMCARLVAELATLGALERERGESAEALRAGDGTCGEGGPEGWGRGGCRRALTCPTSCRPRRGGRIPATVGRPAAGVALPGPRALRRGWRGGAAGTRRLPAPAA